MQARLFSVEFDELVSKLSDALWSIVLLSSSKIGHGGTTKDCTCSFSQVFAGGGSPVPDTTYETFDVTNLKLTIFCKKFFLSGFNAYIPLSTSCFDVKFHGICVVLQLVQIIWKHLVSMGYFCQDLVPLTLAILHTLVSVQQNWETYQVLWKD